MDVLELWWKAPKDWKLGLGFWRTILIAGAIVGSASGAAFTVYFFDHLFSNGFAEGFAAGKAFAHWLGGGP